MGLHREIFTRRGNMSSKETNKSEIYQSPEIHTSILNKQFGYISILIGIAGFIMLLLFIIISQIDDLGPWIYSYKTDELKQFIRYCLLAFYCTIPMVNLVGIMFGISSIIRKEKFIIRPIIGIIMNIIIFFITICTISFFWGILFFLPLE
jgi:hypothetical protein